MEKPLSGLCDIKHGFTFKSKYFTDQGDYVMLTPGNFYETGGYRDRGEKQKYYCGEIPNGFILEKGDMLVAMTEQAAGLLGSPILIPEPNKFLHNQRLGLVIKKPGIPQGHRIKIGGLGRMANSAFGGKLNLCGTSSHLFTIFVVALVVDNKYNVYVR